MLATTVAVPVATEAWEPPRPSWPGSPTACVGRTVQDLNAAGRRIHGSDWAAFSSEKAIDPTWPSKHSTLPRPRWRTWLSM